MSEEDPCDHCEGSGFGPCANCGDLFEIECACDDPQETECDNCGGTGVNTEASDESDKEQ